MSESFKSGFIYGVMMMPVVVFAACVLWHIVFRPFDVIWLLTPGDWCWLDWGFKRKRFYEWARQKSIDTEIARDRAEWARIDELKSRRP